MSSDNSIEFHIQSANNLSGLVRVPGDKSISHRSIMLGSLAEGITHVRGFLEGEDALATMNIFRALGVHIEGPEAGQVTIKGVGLRGLKPPKVHLDCGNSGTSMRLLSGLLAGQGFESLLIGDESLSKRPMKRVIDPLVLMGAEIESAEAGRPPLRIKAKEGLRSIHYDLPMASAQVKSCILLAGLYAEGVTSVTEPAVTRDHTERMLRGFGAEVKAENGRISVEGGQILRGAEIDVPSDISSAAFIMVAASICERADVTLKHVGMNPTRIGIIEILKLMGANLEVSNEAIVGGEPVADIRVRHAQLNGIVIPENLVPLAIDEFPVLFVAAANARGQTVLTGAEELRVKESDRIAVMAEGLKGCGIQAEPTEDGMVIQGLGDKSGSRYQGVTVQSHGDHRIAMSFAVAALRCDGVMKIQGAQTVNTSFPGFVPLMQSLGMNIRALEMPS